MEVLRTQDGLEAIVALEEEECKRWRKKIGEIRALRIVKPTQLIDDYFENYRNEILNQNLSGRSSEIIRQVRLQCWRSYIESELQLYQDCMIALTEQSEVPSQILQSLIDERFFETVNDNNIETSAAILRELVGNYTGRIFPYLYELSKSVTQSRRSRAGKEFESIIRNIMLLYEYPYDTQSSLGQRNFAEMGLGKKVDGVFPSAEAFTISRQRCIIVTMKTTIRERWQEVVEEINRTNIPSIYLLTMDQSITRNTLEIMNNHNITLVTYDDIKDNFLDVPNIMSFETFFDEEIPHNRTWWQSNHLGLYTQALDNLN